MIIEIGLFWHREYVLLIAPVHHAPTLASAGPAGLEN